MIFVFDSSPLIYLARSGALPFLTALKGEKYLPPIVFDEVVTTGRVHGFPDAEITDQFIIQGVLQVKSPEERVKEGLRGLHRDLHAGEIRVLALADELNGIVIIDDRIGREIGEMFQIEVRGSVFILFLLVRDRIITQKKAKQILRVMVREGFRIGAEQCLVFHDLLDQVPEEK